MVSLRKCQRLKREAGIRKEEWTTMEGLYDDSGVKLLSSESLTKKREGLLHRAVAAGFKGPAAVLSM